MGKGDQRSRRGKIWRGTFGKRRPKTSHHAVKPAAAAPPAPPEAPAPPVSKPVRKKAATVSKPEPVESAENTPPEAPAA